MKKPKSLRLFLLLLALILTSQVLGTAMRHHQFGFYLLAALILISGLTVLTKKLDWLTIALNIAIAVVVLIFFIAVPQPWPLYLLYWFYTFLSLLFCSLKIKLKI